MARARTKEPMRVTGTSMRHSNKTQGWLVYIIDFFKQNRKMVGNVGAELPELGAGLNQLNLSGSIIQKGVYFL